MEFGGIKFLSCLAVTMAKKINLCHNFWTIRDRDFIFGMYTQLMNPFQMKPRLMNLTVTFHLHLKTLLPLP